jgi:hypothetical protein
VKGEKGKGRRDDRRRGEGAGELERTGSKEKGEGKVVCPFELNKQS